MSRTTTALKRLGVPAVAAITIFAGLPAIMATSASAAPGDVVTVTPEADTATAGTCNPFTVTARNASGAPATSTVDVNIEERTPAGTAATETFDVTFCTAPTGGVTPQTASDVSASNSTLANDTDHAEFTVASDGTFTFGILGNQAGVADVNVFIDDSTAGFNNDVRDNGEIGDTAVKTYVAGGADVVRSVVATPETATNFVGEPHTVDALLKDVNGNTVPGVTPSADITSGPNNGITPICTVSNNDGVSKCTYNGATAGTDTIVVWVNNSNPDGNTTTTDATAGLDAGEASDTVTKTYQTGPTGLVVDITCGAATTSRSSAEDCFNPLTDNTEVFTATVTGPDGTDAGTERDVAPNVSIAFSVTPDGNTTNGAETVSPAIVTTDANGVATTTLTDTKPTEGEVVTVTATVRGQAAGVGTADSGTKTFRTADDSTARNINITSGDTTTTTPGQFREITALVTNVYGEVVPGVEVTFSEVGSGSFRNGSSSVVTTTDANGIARADVTSGAGETGAQTITARITEAGTQCSQLAGQGTGATGTTPAGDCDDTTTNTFGGTASPTATPTATSTATPGQCAVVPTVTLEFGTINATGSSGVTVTAPANSQIQLLAYSQPNTTYRVVRNATIDNQGTPAQFRITPPTNTRLYAQIVGCTTNPTTASKVLNVRTTLSLNVTRTGVRAYRFFGDSLPARPGGLIVSLYRVTNSGSQVLTSQVRASASTGDWVINRVFTGTGRFGFVVRTGQDLQNAPGASNVRSLLIF